MDIKKYLSENFFLFKGLKSSEIAKLLANETFVIEKFTSGEILHSNKTTKKIGIILKGRAVIKSSDDGVIIKKLSSNDIFGAASLFDAPNYLTYVLSTTDGEMISLSEEFIKKCICTNTSLSLKYISFLSQKISFLNSKISAYTAKSAENKLYAFLLQQPRKDNVIELTVNMATIAKMIGIGRATLYRAFDKLISDGLIIKNEKNIIICEV